MNIVVVARKFIVSSPTLYDHVKSKPLKRIAAGAPTILTASEIVASLPVPQEIGFGMTKDVWLFVPI